MRSDCAVEPLINLLTGKPVPEQVDVPTILMVRQSCGCQNPYVAETIVDLGIDWGHIETMSNLQTGLRTAIAGPGKK
ncbi:MAG: hypothetical protein JW953_06980 [Anaerolineae bacterium]|nr:hypothetical protein [Anaerolineae bacterium]